MLESLKQVGKNVGQGLERAWENLTEGWHELRSRSGSALTHFVRPQAEGETEGDELTTLPRWSLLAGEIEETASDIVVRLELPGVAKADCRITVEGNMLYVSGEKRAERESHDSAYLVMERAYGSFRRVVSLPRQVDAERAKASYENGVLTVRLPKIGAESTRVIPVS